MLCVSIISVRAEEAKPILEMCIDTVNTCTEQVDKQRNLIDTQEETLTKLIKQRNDIYKEIDADDAALPWYFWTVFGIAAGAILSQTVVFK